MAPAAVGDHDRDVGERLDQQVRQVVERLAHELLEVVRVVRVALEEVGLVGLGGEVVARELLGADHEALELVLVDRLAVVGRTA